MSVGHTPGPWEALPPVKSEGHIVYVQVRAKGERLATTCVYGKNEKLETGGEKYKDRFSDERHEPIITGAEAVANAKLIAAAPELVEELRSTLMALPDHSADCKRKSVAGAACCFFAERHRNARAAIAKAVSP